MILERIFEPAPPPGSSLRCAEGRSQFRQLHVRQTESRKIVAAVVGLGHSLGMTTVAEGIETEEQADMLLRLGCEFGQGWLYGRPVTADRIPQLVADAPRIHSSGSLALERLGRLQSRSNAAQRLAELQAIYDGAPVGLCFLDVIFAMSALTAALPP